MRGVLLCALMLVGGAGCGSSTVPPAAIDPGHDACGSCRMIIADVRMASQVVAPLEEPRFFDDLNCLSAFLKATPALPKGAVVYVSDHRSRAWVRWDEAVYTRVETLSGPMGSHVIAHASAASRDADPDAAHGTSIVARDVFPPFSVSGGS